MKKLTIKLTASEAKYIQVILKSVVDMVKYLGVFQYSIDALENLMTQIDEELLKQ